MRRKVLVTVLLLSVAGLACDDADPPRPKDGGTDARKDGGSDARDAAADRTPDAGTAVDAPVPDAAVPDKGPDSPLPDSSVPDKAADSPAPTPDTNPPDINPTPDTNPPPDTAPPTPDTSPPDTAEPDAAIPDTALPDTAIPDTALPDTALPADAQQFNAMNGCDDVDQFVLDATPDDPFPMDWADEYPADDPVCYKVKVGDTVVWAVGTLAGHETETFATHPVVQSPTDVTSPIAGKNAANQDDYEVTFTVPGTYGFQCSSHANMKGAIWVVPSL